jgi:hypothetical protein
MEELIEDALIDAKAGEAKPIEGKPVQTSYPSEPIFPSLNLVKQVVTAKGEINPISRKDISIITEKSEATLSMKLSTCVQYGLLKVVFGKGYLPGALYHKYVYEDQATALLQIFSSPALYYKLINDLNGKILPNEGDFANHLKNNYRLHPNSAERAAKIFLENARNLNLIDSNNRLKFIIKNTPAGEESGSAIKGNNEGGDPLDTPPPPPPPTPPPVDDLFELPIPLGKGRKAYLKYPIEDLGKKDIKIIVKALAFIASSIEGDDDDFEIQIVERKKEQS